MRSILVLCALLFCCPALVSALPPPSDYDTIKPDKELLGYALHLQDYVDAGFRERLVSEVDLNALQQRFVNAAGPSTPASIIKTIMDEIRHGNIFDTFAPENEVTFHFIRARQGNGSYFLLYRIENDELLSYVEFEVVKDRDDFSIVDWYQYDFREWASDALAFHANAVMEAALSGFGNIGGLNSVGNFMAAIKRGDYSTAKSRWDKLPKAIKQSNGVLSQLMAVAAAKSDADYLSVVGDIYREFPQALGDTTLIGYFYSLNDTDAMQKSFDRLHRELGGDAALYDLLANMYLNEGDVDEVLATSLKALQLDRGYEDTYFTLLFAFAKTNRYEEALLAVKLLANQFDYQFDADVDFGDSDVQRFIRSKTYMNWINAR